MPKLQEQLHPGRDTERRAVGRTTINRDALMYFAGREIVHACCLRNISDHGAGLRLNGLNIIPSEFGVSFDGFCTMRVCRLVWRDGDFVFCFRELSDPLRRVTLSRGLRCRANVTRSIVNRSHPTHWGSRAAADPELLRSEVRSWREIQIVGLTTKGRSSVGS
jgi:hypothetical protein